MLLIGVGVGTAFPSLMTLAMSGATPEDAGPRLGRGQHQHAGGRRDRPRGAGDAGRRAHRQLLDRRRRPTLAALNSGYHLAYVVGAGLVGAALAIAVIVLRAEPMPDPAALAEARRPRSRRAARSPPTRRRLELASDEACVLPPKEDRPMGQPVVHFEVIGKDAGQAAELLLRPVRLEVDADNPMNYGIVKGEDNPSDWAASAAASAAPGPDGYEGHVTFYVAVPDVEAALQKAEEPRRDPGDGPGEDHGRGRARPVHRPGGPPDRPGQGLELGLDVSRRLRRASGRRGPRGRRGPAGPRRSRRRGRPRPVRRR